MRKKEHEDPKGRVMLGALVEPRVWRAFDRYCKLRRLVKGAVVAALVEALVDDRLQDEIEADIAKLAALPDRSIHSDEQKKYWREHAREHRKKKRLELYEKLKVEFEGAKR